MTTQANYRHVGEALPYTALAAIAGGDVLQLPCGLAAVNPTARDAGDLAEPQVRGVFRFDKTANIALLDGGRAYFDVSAGTVTFAPGVGTPDFYLGRVVGDFAAAATYVDVAINEKPVYAFDLQGQGQEWLSESALGLGVTVLPGGGIQLAFDAVAEVAQAALYAKHTVPFSAKPILECRLAVYAIGDNAALDIDIGMATGSHASDFESVTAFAAFHLDGNDLSLLTHSDDGTTDRAAADSTVDAVDDTQVELWIDMRDDTDVKFYIDGALVNTSASKRILTAALALLGRPVVMIEKTSDDTVADVRVYRLNARTQTE